MAVNSPQSTTVESTRLFPIPSPKTHSTKLYEQVIREADGPDFFNRKDGQASRAELEKYDQSLQQQIQFFGFLKQFFGPIFGKSIDGYLDHLKDKSDVTNIMLKNFNTFDTGGNSKDPFVRRDGRISASEVQNVAGRDGNPHDVSWRDLMNFRPFPPFPPFPSLELYARGQDGEGIAGSALAAPGDPAGQPEPAASVV